MWDARAIITIVIVVLTCATVSFVTLAKAWFARPRGDDSRQLNEIAERLANLERAVDAIAVETERISEGQRFTTRLLSERSESKGAAV